MTLAAALMHEGAAMAPFAEPSLTPEEQAQIMEIQERLIELFAAHAEALAAGDASRAEGLKREINGLLRWRDDIKMWAGADGV
jgi:hypothetical protein